MSSSLMELLLKVTNGPVDVLETIRDQMILGWVMSNQYQVLAATVDANNVVQSARVQWPDGRQGNYTIVSQNQTFAVADAYTLTYEYGTSGVRTVTQPVGVVRNSAGAITSAPALTIG